MKKTALLLLCLAPSFAFGQLVINSTGNWSNSAIWDGGDIGDQSSEDVDMQSNVTVTVQNGETYTIGDLTANNNNAITINSGGSLSLSPGSFLAAGNGTTITVSGNFLVNGNFTVLNNVTLIVTGTMTVTGNVDMGNNGDLIVNGNVNIGGNLTGGENTDVVVNGAVSVGGTITIDNNSDLSGSGTLTTGGPCTGPSSFCGQSQLPITLLFFTGNVSDKSTVIEWATSFERNVRHFVIEKSNDGLTFEACAMVPAKVGSNEMRRDYQYVDLNPFVGYTYYRLKEIDFDDYTKEFDIIAVRYEGQRKSRVYPNPVTNSELRFTVNFTNDSALNFSITSSTGVVLQQGFSNSPDTSIPIDLKPGVYFLRLNSGDYNSVERFVVK